MNAQGIFKEHHSPCVYEEDITLLEWIEERMGDLHCCPNTNGTCSKIKSVIKQRIDELEEEKKEEEEKHALWTNDFNKEETDCLKKVFKVLKKWEIGTEWTPTSWHKPKDLYRLSPTFPDTETNIDDNWPEDWIKKPGFSPSLVDTSGFSQQTYPFIIAYTAHPSAQGWYLRVSTDLEQSCADILYRLLINKKFGNEQWEYIKSPIKQWVPKATVKITGKKTDAIYQ